METQTTCRYLCSFLLLLKKYTFPSSEITGGLEPGLLRLYPGFTNIFMYAHTQFHLTSFLHVYILAQRQVYGYIHKCLHIQGHTDVVTYWYVQVYTIDLCLLTP